MIGLMMTQQTKTLNGEVAQEIKFLIADLAQMYKKHPREDIKERLISLKETYKIVKEKS